MYKNRHNLMHKILALLLLLPNNISFVYGGKRFKSFRSIDDEYYTRLEDIELEMSSYLDRFIDQTIYCNCDDYNKSNFCKYFRENFEKLKLKRFIATSYVKNGKGKLFIKTKDGDEFSELNGNGSFDSEECLKYLDECDIVISNPPFSLLNRYYKILKQKEKKFLFVGSWNKISNRVFFYDVKNKLILPGVHHLTKFTGPLGEPKKQTCIWYTNLSHISQETLSEQDKEFYEERLILNGNELTKEELEQCSNNSDVFVSVDKLEDIPTNFQGPIIVPVSYFGKSYNNEFSIIGNTRPPEYRRALTDENGNPKFTKLIIVHQCNGKDSCKLNSFIHKKNTNTSTLKVLQKKNNSGEKISNKKSKRTNKPNLFRTNRLKLFKVTKY